MLREIAHYHNHNKDFSCSQDRLMQIIRSNLEIEAAKLPDH